MNIGVIGSGYVGLVTGACFADMGHNVICVDTDSKKIDMLNRGEIPIWEPGLDTLIKRNASDGRISFTLDLKHAVDNSQVLFIAVGTPPGEDGSADLQYVLAVAEGIAQHMNSYKVIVDKSTVPVGTADLVNNTIKDVLTKRGIEVPYDVVSNPEFLKEGAAIEDFMKPDRIVVGSDSTKAINIMKDVYASFNLSSDRLITMSARSAEMTKYAANAMLATKISFINEIANLCERYGADVMEVRHGIGSDSRIGYKFIYPGVGYGGSCFPKDIKALIHMANEKGFEPKILNAVEARNSRQKEYIVHKVLNHFGDDLRGIKLAIWGLSFKPNTDDMREAPSQIVTKMLLEKGAQLSVYDPIAINEAKGVIGEPEGIEYCESQYDAIIGSDALILLTEWHQFRNPDFDRLKKEMRSTVIFDGRNQYNPVTLKELGFDYYGIGR